MKRNIFWVLMIVASLTQMAMAQSTGTTAPPQPQVMGQVADARGYLLGPGDQITAKVLSEEQFNFIAEVTEDGTLEVPYLDQPINAMCKNERQIRAEVMKALSKYLKAPQLSLQVTERKSRPPVTINGQVRQPMQVTMYRKARLLELISTAGGVTEDSGGLIQVFRTQAPICGEPEEVAEWKAQAENNGGVVTGIYSYSNLRLGTPEANPLIYPGDFIVVPKAAPVYFTGEVRAAQGIYIPEGGLSLFQAISMLGGVNPKAKTKDIKIYRLKANSKDREVISVNYDKIRKLEEKDVMLEPYDVIEVDKSKKSIGQTILELATGIGMSTVQTLGTGLPTKILY